MFLMVDLGVFVVGRDGYAFGEKIITLPFVIGQHPAGEASQFAGCLLLARSIPPCLA
jgi:hypothetical protein